MSLYLDASTIVPLVVSEASSEAVERFVGSGERLSISDYAVAETVRQAVRAHAAHS